MTIDELLARLDHVQRQGAGYRARCPAHADHQPSLHLRMGQEGRLLLHCFAGCSTESILASLHLTLADLFPTQPSHAEIVSTYDYRDEQGHLLFQTVRLLPKAFRQRRPDGAGGWTWSLQGVRRVLYRLPELLAADRSETVFVCEGEKDVDRLVGVGLVATTNPCGAGQWKAEYSVALKGRHVVLLPDADEPGRRHARQVAVSLRGMTASLKVLELRGLPAKGDVSDWLEQGGDAVQLRVLAAATREYQPPPLPSPVHDGGGRGRGCSLVNDGTRSSERSGGEGGKGWGCSPLTKPTRPDDSLASSPFLPEPPEGWRPLDEVLACLARSEWGDAELLARLYAGQIAFDHAAEQWCLFRGPYWEPDRKAEMRTFVSEGIAAQYQHAVELKEQELDGASHRASQAIAATLAALRRRLHALRDSQRITRVLREAAAQPELALTGDEWDAHPTDLATLDGVVDLRTGAARPGKPTDYLRSYAPTRWQGLEAPCPRFEQFIAEILNGETERVRFLQRLLGYGLLGHPTEHILPVLQGVGRNGKDTLLETLHAVLGPHLARPISNEVLLESGHRDPNAPTPALYDLRGLRIGWVNESNEGARLNVSQVKWLVGGGTIWARPLHGHPVTFQPRHLLLLETNHLPQANGDDYALWQRLLLVRFTQRFLDEPQGANEHPRDPVLREKLAREASGILAWLVRGALAYQREGLQPPEGVKLATREYQAEEDTLGQFVEERCQVAPTEQVRAGVLYQAYREWAEGSGLRPISRTGFGRRMGERYEKKRNPGSVYLGIGLKA